MLRLKDIPPEQMPEVVRIASQLYEKDQRRAEQDQERESYVNAAEELGVPKEYLERAAAELHKQRVIEAQTQQQTKSHKTAIFTLIGAGSVALLLLGSIVLVRPERAPLTAPRPVEVGSAPVATPATMPFEFESFDSLPETRWSLDRNAGTQAEVTYANDAGRGRVAVIRVDRFSTSGGQKHRANFDSVLAPPTAAHREMTFEMRGEGLPKVRVYLEMGNQTRWRSPELTVPAGWSTFRVDLNNFERQVREGNRWRSEGSGRPDGVTRVSFKFGDFMNPASAQGEVRLDNIRFE